MNAKECIGFLLNYMYLYIKKVFSFIKSNLMKKLSIAIILIAFFSITVDAQILDRIMKRVEDRVEQKLEEKVADKISDKIDEKIDEALEDEETSESEYKDQSNNDREEAFAKMFGGSKAKHDSYSFKGQIQMKITSSGEDPADFEYYFNTENQHFMMKIENPDNRVNTLMVFADDQFINFMDNDGKKSMFILPSNLGEKMADKVSPDEDFDKSKLKKTGKTKRILGYLCHEYVMDEDDTHISSWVTTDIEVPNIHFDQKGENQMEGYALETNITKDGKSTNVLVVKIDLDKKYEIKTSQYK